MASLFADVDGCNLDMKEFHSHITFESPSNALFASIHFKYKDALPMTIFDDFLSLFQHASFNSKDVTFRQTEDIFDRVADQRRAIMTGRNAKRTTERNPSTDHSRLQRLVPELLADYYDTVGRSPFHSAIKSNYPDDLARCHANRSLATMTLVHRSWADVAQRFLRRRFYVQDQDTLRSVLQNPLLGPEVRELSFCGMLWEMQGLEEETRYFIAKKEMPRLLCKVLTRCSNITYLHLQYFDLDDSNAYKLYGGISYDFIDQMSNLKCLEHLWLYRVNQRAPDRKSMEKLCTAISGLRSLKSIQLKDWEVPDKEYITTKGVDGVKNTLDVIVKTGLPPSLDSISLVSVNITSSGLLSWITNPRNENRITRLELAVKDMVHHSGVQPIEISASIRQLFTNSMATHITKLQILNYMENDSIGSIISNLPSLYLLSLSVRKGSGLPSNPFVFPKSTKVLRVYFPAVPNQSQDPHVLAIIKTNPTLCQILLSINIWTCHSGNSKPPPKLLCEDTLAYIKSKKVNHIRFELNRVQGAPHFLDL